MTSPIGEHLSKWTLFQSPDGVHLREFLLYFQNFKSLKLMKEWNVLGYNPQLKKEKRHLESLKKVVNLSNLQHLDVKSIYNIISPTILLEILKQAPQLSSLVIDKPTLISFLTNNQLYLYLNKMIKILDITNNSHDQFIYVFILDYFSLILTN